MGARRWRVSSQAPGSTVQQHSHGPCKEPTFPSPRSLNALAGSLCALRRRSEQGQAGLPNGGREAGAGGASRDPNGKQAIASSPNEGRQAGLNGRQIDR